MKCFVCLDSHLGTNPCFQEHIFRSMLKTEPLNNVLPQQPSTTWQWACNFKLIFTLYLQSSARPFEDFKPLQACLFTMAMLQLTANSFLCKWSSWHHILEFAPLFPEKVGWDLWKHLGTCTLHIFSSLEIQAIKKNWNRGKKQTVGKKVISQNIQTPCRKAHFTCSFSQIDGEEELPGISHPNQSLGKSAPTATDIGSGPGSALNFLWDWELFKICSASVFY